MVGRQDRIWLSSQLNKKTGIRRSIFVIIAAAVGSLLALVGVPKLIAQQEQSGSRMTVNVPSAVPNAKDVEELQIPDSEKKKSLRIVKVQLNLDADPRGLRNRGLASYCNSIEGWNSVFCLEEYLRSDGADSEAYGELALAYLSFGRFDSSISVCQRGLPFAKNNKALLTLSKNSKKVKQCLTSARDQLRNDGQDVTFPDEKIFFRAVKSADFNDKFLVLNLLDAWSAAHPNSAIANRFLAHCNLTYAESAESIKSLKVPELRAYRATWRGDFGLDQLHKIDPGATYPALRYMQHVIATSGNNVVGMTRQWRKLPDPIWHALKTMDKNSNYTDQQKAYLLFGRTMHLLRAPGWEVAVADYCVENLEKVVAFDPENELYAETLATVKENSSKIDKVKLAQGKQEAETARQHAAATYGIQSYRLDRDDGGKDLAGSFYRGMYDLIVDTIEEKDPSKAKLMHETFGCPTCWGTGRHLRSGEKCFVCGGDGDSRN